MKDELKKTINSGRAVDRADMLMLLQAALEAGEPRFVRQLAEEWLNAYPYDLPIEFLRAEAYRKDSQPGKAVKILSRLVELDPEYTEAQQLLNTVARRVKPDLAEQARSAAAALAHPSQAPEDIQDWAKGLVRAQIALQAKDNQKAESEVQTVLAQQPPSPLPALLHIQISQAEELSWQALFNLVELYRQQWPQCLQFRLMEAAQRMESGQEDQAIDLLHNCVAEDVSGQAARRLWGEGHRFSAIWPSQLTYVVNLPIPAGVAAALNWNHLSAGESVASGEPATAAVMPAAPKSAQPEPQEPVSVGPLASLEASAENSKLPKLKRPKIQRVPPKKKGETYFDELGVEYIAGEGSKDRKKKALEPETPLEIEDLDTKTEDLRLRADGRFPAYVVITSQAALRSQYGPDGSAAIDVAMQSVVTATSANPYWDAHLVYVDDQQSLEKFGLQPVKADDPWDVKHLLADLDAALRKKGEMIGAVLIVGGPQVIPFHHLPNPVDDEDQDVPSDNPYACIDENYFVPAWPLGRLPNGEGSDPAMLVKVLNKIAAGRSKGATPIETMRGFFARILAFFGLYRPKRSSFGYSAEVWQRASLSVYRTISEPSRLSVCPPAGTGDLPKEAGKPLQLAYYNLHGMAETAEWYGQRDPQTTPDGPDYPVALRPSDVINSGRAPQVVFTEACYGAYIFDKTVENALSLKFLDSGSKAVIGSTVTSYGSVTTPLIAADLLGQAFWKLLNEGHPVGEALRRAKIAMAQAMHSRQGYLDGEDQKTLISFVLYGDPLAQVAAEGQTPKRILRVSGNSREVQVVCDHGNGQHGTVDSLPAETIATVKSVVAEYLPGMLDSQATYSHEHTECQGHNCTLPHVHSKAHGLVPTRSLVTLSKKISDGDLTHSQYARITMDARGKVVKMAVSR